MKSNWTLGCMTRDRYSDGRNTVQHARDCDVGQMATFKIETVTRGKLIVAGVPGDQIQLSAFPPVFGGRSI